MRTPHRSSLLIGLAVGVGAVLAVLLTMPGLAAADVSQPVVTNNTPTAAAGGQTIYSIAFNTSSTAAWQRRTRSRSPFPREPISRTSRAPRSRTARARNVGFCTTANLTATCSLSGSNTIANNSAVTVELDGVVNPATANSYTVVVRTTKDTNRVTSASYSVVAAHQISQPVVSDSPPSQAAGAQSDYTVSFNTSSTGALSSTAGSQISLTGFPAGTDFSHVVADAIHNGSSTSAPQVGFCNEDNTAKTVTCS